MNWKVRSNGNVITFGPTELLQQLFSKLVRSDEAFDVLAKELVQSMERSQAFSQARVVDLIRVALVIGYYYKVFLVSNEVETIVKEKE